MDAHRHYAPAALALAIEAWRQGNDVYQAVSQAGYAVTVAAGLASYVGSAGFSASQPFLEESSQADEMSAKRARTSSSTVSVAPSVKKYVKGCMDRLLEEKQFPLVLTSSTNLASGLVTKIGLYDIVQGSTSTTRNGDIIHLERVILNWYAYDTTSAQVRVILFVDRQANGLTPSTTDVLAQVNVVSPYNQLNVIGYGGGRFKILSDETATINPVGVAAQTRIHQKEWKVKMPVIYTGSTGTAADISKNNLWVMLVSDNNTSTFVRASVIYFTDN